MTKNIILFSPFKHHNAVQFHSVCNNYGWVNQLGSLYDLLFSIVSNVNIKFEREGSLEQHAKLGDAIAKYLQCQIINDPLTDRGNC